MHPVVEGAVLMTSAPDARVIRTPDQRLRVFVSSTLKELQPERLAARAAIERLHLAPVMFELGARPHPPRELYRAYLDQSDVFIGIYWQEYGWIAPDEEISGLEDEYRLAPREMPKLVYVKQPAEREESLAGLVARIRDDDTTSYKPFSTADELGELIESDLAILLAERFDASRSPAAASAASATADAGTADDAAEHLPLPPDEVLGRETDLMTLLEWLGGDDPRRLVTLVGPGGIGKTRLSIEAARLARDRFDRVTFVALEHVRDPEGVLPAVARALGVRDDGGVPTFERLALARRGRRDLIVLDNFEQVVSAAPQVTSILTELPDATVMVTSRARLRVHGEQVFDVEPLGLPMDPAARSLAEIADAPAVQLFLDRAHAADARFDLTAENAEDVARICRTLDGVPLAIELAAACIRVLTPTAMLAKLDRVLSILKTSDRDMPERQRTIRATVEWSIDLLGPFARALFMRLGVFVGDFSLDAVEAVAGGEVWAVDLPGTLLELVDGSLLRQHDVGGEPFFSMLVPVRELAAMRFARDEDADGGSARARRLLRAPRRGDRTAAARVHAAGRGGAGRGGGPRRPRGVPSPHRDRRGRHGRGCGVADAPVLVDQEPPAHREVLDGSPPRVRRAAHGSQSGDRDHVLVLGRPRAPRHRGRPGAARSRPPRSSTPPATDSARAPH